MFKSVSLIILAVAAGSLLAAGGSGGGGGNTGGGGAGGGSASGPCSNVSSFSVSSSRSPYGSPLTDVKVSYTLKPCTATFVPSTNIRVTNVDTGVVAWSATYGGLIVTTPPYGNLPVSTTFRVDMTVTDFSTGTVVDTRTGTTTTPAAKVLGVS